MNYNYTDSPFYANLVETGLVVDTVEKVNLVVEKREWVPEGEEMVRKISFFTYDATGLTIQEVDQLARTKINELKAASSTISLEPQPRQL